MGSKKKFQAVIFDLDGVITKTADVHSAAWKQMFDEFLRHHARSIGTVFREFTHAEDYLPYVDGKPRYKGVADFLASRNIVLPYGNPDDAPDTQSVCGLGNRKNDLFNYVLQRDGVSVYPSTVALMQELREQGYRVGVASSSKNCEAVLTAAALTHLIETRVDGVVSAELGLHGKPEADIFLAAAENLGCEPAMTVIVEDAVSGVQAGRKGNFGLVIGLARENNHQELYKGGADIVVNDMDEFGLSDINHWFAYGIEKDSWNITYYDYDPEKERSREALLTIGNGYFGTRGAIEETKANPVNYPGTYMAGLYNRLITHIAGRDIENEDFVNIPNWLTISFRIDNGEWIDPNTLNILSIKRQLHLNNGLLEREMIVEDDTGRQTYIHSKRFVSMKQMHLAAMQYAIKPLNYDGLIEIRSGIDGAVINAGVERYKTLNQTHLNIIQTGTKENILFLVAQTTQSQHTIALSTRHTYTSDADVALPTKLAKLNTNHVYETASIKLKAGQLIQVEKIISISCDKEELEKDTLSIAMQAVRQDIDFDSLLGESGNIWKEIWDKIDVRIEGDRLSQRLLRLHLYHLMVSVSPVNTHLDASITARGLHGEAYRGHVFWDELFIMPLYDLHLPEVAKSMLMYRYRRLDKAREYAAAHGYKGAMFPWQSGSDGREETQIVHLNPLTGEWGDDHSALQRHVSLAVAYNIWDYYWITDDNQFMKQYGMEMFFEICRFWAHKAVYDPKTDRYEISGVMGPDEFHEHMPGKEEGGLKNNAYSNLMVAWMLAKAQDIVAITGWQAIKEKGFDEDELAQWKLIRSKLAVPMNEQGIIAQFDGYFDLLELDWEYYRKKYTNIYRMDRILKAEGKSPDDYKVAKQADTLMTFYNLTKKEVDTLLHTLGYKMPLDYIEKNLRYYLARTSHGSTLSRVVHARLAAMAGDSELSWKLYQEALASDYVDIQGGTTAEGIHTGVMAGTVLLALTTYAGINYREKYLSLTPDLPKQWKKMSFNIHFKQIEYHFQLEHDRIKVRPEKEVVLVLNQQQYSLTANQWNELKLISKPRINDK
ncbi:MAG: HAD-IA family hydrolase [Bacteroidales bacterium]|nr:HAD-IA family hydrolase [Bacteroidales bacterium]